MKCYLILILLIFSCYAVPGFTKFDYGTSVVSRSPFSPLILFRDTPPLMFEAALTNYFGFSPFVTEERLISSDWGALYGYGIHRWSLTLEHLDAFSLYKEFSSCISYGVTPLSMLSFHISGGVKVLSVEYDSDSEYMLGMGTGFHYKKFFAGVTYDARHLSNEHFRSIPLGELSLLLSLNENRLGSQGARFFWNHTDRSGYLTITQSYPVTKWLTLSASMKSEPFLLGLSFVLNFGRVQSGVLFSRHSVLGWSQTGAVQVVPQMVSADENE